MRKRSLRAVALGYLLIVLLGPLAMVFYRTFERGSDPALGRRSPTRTRSTRSSSR